MRKTMKPIHCHTAGCKRDATGWWLLPFLSGNAGSVAPYCTPCVSDVFGPPMQRVVSEYLPKIARAVISALRRTT